MKSGVDLVLNLAGYEWLVLSNEKKIHTASNLRNLSVFFWLMPLIISHLASSHSSLSSKECQGSCPSYCCHSHWSWNVLVQGANIDPAGLGNSSIQQNREASLSGTSSMVVWYDCAGGCLADAAKSGASRARSSPSHENPGVGTISCNIHPPFRSILMSWYFQLNMSRQAVLCARCELTPCLVCFQAPQISQK